MKDSLFPFALTPSIPALGNRVIARRILIDQDGITLSYSSEYINILNCGNNRFDRYEVTAYLENSSGHTIDIDTSEVSHTFYRNQVDVAPCRHPFPSMATLNTKTNWPNNSSDQAYYYVFVPRGKRLPEPNWNLGSYTLKD